MRRLFLLVLLAGCGAAPIRESRPLPLPPPVVDEELTFPLPGAFRCSRGFEPENRHFALDVPAAEGTPVLASGDGLVVRASPHPAYGLAVILLHPGLTYTLYAHLSMLAVTAGERVAARAKIGEVGRTGNASGPHLHFEVLAASAPLSLRATGPIGLAGEQHRVDPASVIALPPGCHGDQLSRR